MAKDPVCGMEVIEKTAKHKTEYKGKTYYFCSQMCKTTFDKNPAKYAAAKHSPQVMRGIPELKRLLSS